MSEIKLFYPGQEDIATSSSLLDGLGMSEDVKSLEFVIRTLEKIFDYKLSINQRHLVLTSMQKIILNKQQITMLDCYEEWYKYSVLDNWSANVKRYFLF